MPVATTSAGGPIQSLAENVALQLLDQSREAVIACDDKGRILYVNCAAERMLGCRRARCVGRRIAEALPDLGDRSVRRQYSHAKPADGAVEFDVVLARTKRPVRIRAVPNQRGVTLFLLDISREQSVTAALYQSEERFRATFEQAPVGIEQVALHDGSLLDVNHRLCDMLGYSRGELLATTFAAITDPSDLRRERKLLRDLVSDATPSYAIEKRYRHRDGHWVWVRVTSAKSRAATNGRPYRISIVEDITTSRNDAEERERLAAIVESSEDAILSEGLDGIVNTWNSGAERLFGYSAAEMVGRPISMIIPPDRKNEEHQFFTRIGRGLRIEHYETVRRRKDGHLLDVSLSLSPLRDWRGRIIGAAKIIRDISRSKGQERELRESEARTRAIVELAVDAIIVIDERGHITNANPATERLFGYRADEMLGRNVSMLMPEPYRGQHDQYLARYLRTGKARIIGIDRDVTGQRKDGSTFPLSLAVSEMRVGDRRMFTGIIHDLTQRRRLENEVLQAATDEQRRIGQDLHDGLCQELVGLSIAAELLARRLDAAASGEAATARKFGGEVQSAAEQARRLSHGLNPIDIEADGLPGALERLTRRVGEATGVRCEFRWNEQPLEAKDSNLATHLYRIAQEAVANAVKHARATRIDVMLEASRAGATLTIADNGRGITVKNRESLASAPHAEAPPDVGIGLRTMNYRARMIGGELTIGRGRPGGTQVICSLKFDQQLTSKRDTNRTRRSRRSPRP